jgi:hypothetical protein
VLLLGGVHYIASNPERFARWQKRLAILPPFIQTLRLEALLATLTLLAAAVLSASAVPEPVFPMESAAPSERVQLGDLSVRQTISPGGPGLNSFDTLVQSDAVSLDEAQVEMQIVTPERDWRSAWTEVPPAADGLYIATSDEIDREGRWWTLLDITLPGSEAQRAAFKWEISREAAVPTALSPGPLNVAALLGVLLALGWASFPLLRRFVRWLDWRPASVAIASAVLLATAFLFIIAVQAIKQSEAAYQLAISPPPQVINSVLPDADSLVLGRELYIAHCIGWQSFGEDFRALKERLPRSRDEELYRATREGWRSLPFLSYPGRLRMILWPN